MLNKVYERIKKFIINNYKFFLIIILLFLAFTYELPYVVYKPGGLVNLNDRISIDNDNIKGSFSMCYVSLMKGTLPVLALSYVFPNWDIKPSKDITIDGGSVDELITLEKLYYDSSINTATILAYQKAGEKIDITKTNLNVIYIADEAVTNIKLYDKLVSVEGKKITSLEELKELVNTYKEHDKIKIEIERNGKIVETESEIYKMDNELKVGVSLLATYDYKTEIPVSIKTKSSESGSSGGLMLTLAIYNKLTEEDITKGKKIVGTGTIDVNGVVGEIDGVKYKLLGAEKNGGEIFLCPNENYEEALKVKRENNLKIVVKAVTTFDEALSYLTSLEP